MALVDDRLFPLFLFPFSFFPPLSFSRSYVSSSSVSSYLLPKFDHIFSFKKILAHSISIDMDIFKPFLNEFVGIDWLD